MSKTLLSLQELFKSYKNWVSKNPQFVGDLESTTKWISYFIAGRVTHSSIISELIYSISNIIVLFNDRIIEKANGFVLDEDTGSTLKLMLTTLEYCEVFIEISAKKLWGSKGRWLFITTIQLIKTIGRYLLLYQHSEEIIRVPLIPILDRKKFEKQNENSNCVQNMSGDVSLGECSFAFKLKRSGKIIRKIEGAPPIHLRNWKPIVNESNETQNRSVTFKTAEGLYIAKPLIHLAAIGLFGYRSWKSYSVALLMDLASIRMYYMQRDKLTKKQRVELSRRCVNLLLYFVRSPLYEIGTEKRLKGFIRSVGDNIPLMNSICNPLIEYIPFWQDTYFYMWSS